MMVSSLPGRGRSKPATLEFVLHGSGRAPSKNGPRPSTFRVAHRWIRLLGAVALPHRATPFQGRLDVLRITHTDLVARFALGLDGRLSWEHHLPGEKRARTRTGGRLSACLLAHIDTRRRNMIACVWKLVLAGTFGFPILAELGQPDPCHD